MSDDKMTLIERLQNPAWCHSNALFESPQLEKEQTQNDMSEAAGEITRLREVLIETERFMAYFAGETGGHFVGGGTPKTCLEQIRKVLPDHVSSQKDSGK